MNKNTKKTRHTIGKNMNHSCAILSDSRWRHALLKYTCIAIAFTKYKGSNK